MDSLKVLDIVREEMSGWKFLPPTKEEMVDILTLPEMRTLIALKHVSTGALQDVQRNLSISIASIPVKKGEDMKMRYLRSQFTHRLNEWSAALSQGKVLNLIESAQKSAVQLLDQGLATTKNATRLARLIDAFVDSTIVLKMRSIN